MTNRIYPHNRLIRHARLKLTLILLTLLCVGYAAKADTSCHLVIEVQQNTIDSLQHQLSIAQSVPYNQGYQAGYQAAQTTADNGVIIVLILCGLFYICLTLYFYIFYLKK